MTSSHHHFEDAAPPLWKSKAGITSILLPYLILLPCPWMHLFGHNHGGHTHQGDVTPTKEENRT
jgi:hypothetical protein